MVKIILVTHGEMAEALLNTAAKIYPFDKSSIDVFTVSGKIDLQELSKQVKSKVDSQNGTLILVDTFGGSSCNMVSSLTQGIENIAVLCGVNLNMLLCAISKRDKMSLKDLAAKVVEDGKKAVLNATEKLNEI